MPVSTNGSKLRAKSLGNGNSDLKSRSPEEINMEVTSLRKELVHAKEEGNILKCRMKKMEEENTKKMKLLERNLAAAKKESSDHEKKRESSAESVSVLKQKCQKLEQALKEQDLAMKKLQSSRPARPTELKGLVASYSPNNTTKKNSVDTKDGGKTNSAGSGQTSGPSPSVMNEISRLKETIRKLQCDNTRLQQQLKERNEEVKLLKQQALRSRTTKPSSSGSSSAPSAISRRTMTAESSKTVTVSTENKNNIASGSQQRQSHTTVQRTTLRQSSSATTTPNARNSQSAKKDDATTKKTSPPKKNQTVTQQSTKNKVTGVKNVVSKSPVEPKKGGPVQMTPSKPKTQMNGSPSGNTSMPPQVMETEMSPEAFELQQNVAAKKIQRTWRGHFQKKMNESASSEKMQMEEDVELLQSVLRGHQERLELSAMQDDYGNSTESDLKEALSVVQAAHKNIWNLNAPQEE